MKILPVILWLLFAGDCTAQVVDDFSDGNFLLNPTWLGDQSKFVVSNERLKLQAPALAGTAFLITESQAVQEAVWEFAVQFDFNPSSSNYSKIYLVSDKADLQTALNGYFVKVGHSSKEVSLFVQHGSSETELIDGLDDRLNFSLINLSVRVTRDAAGSWNLFSDVGRTRTYALEGSTIDEAHLVSGYFGIQCFYTPTRSDKFLFDDVIVTGSIVPDTFPPRLLLVEAIDSIRFRATFSEPLDSLSAPLVNQVFISGLGFPESGLLMSDKNAVEWKLASPLINGVTYQVQFSGISDRAGNKMPPTIKSLLFFRAGSPSHKSILITELFPDPTPQLGLPSAEYIEIYNRSSVPFELNEWTLSDGSSIGVFSSAIILPGSYRVITSTSAADLFLEQSDIIGLPNFPSLNNSGDRISLKDPKGVTIDSVNYSIGWYRDDDKATGGWSLELIDPDNPCGESDNWTASEAEGGGTPGIANSVLAQKPDLTPPNIEDVLPLGSSKLSIRFNETIMGESIPSATFLITPEIPIRGISLRDPGSRILEVELFSELKQRTLYRMEVRGIHDCSGNVLDSTSFEFGLTEPVDSLDVVISEVLFNPRSGGVDFVEIYNTSDKFIDLQNWTLENESSRTVLQRRSLHPHQFIALTEDPRIIQWQYPNAAAKNLLKANLPSLPDDSGMIILRSDQEDVVDHLMYSGDWHTEFLKSEEGVSLERIVSDAPTQDSDNWISASSLSGFATPGSVNSQQRPSGTGVQQVEIVPEIFSPGNAAFEFVQIRYQFDQPGRVANVSILNQQGTVIKQICNNELLGSEGFIRWDGDQQDGVKARVGYYVVWFETFGQDGSVFTFHKRVVIVRG